MNWLSLRDLDTFKREADVVVANRITDEIRDVAHKIFSRDLYENNETGPFADSGGV